MLDTVSKLLKFDVLNRFSGKVQFTAEIHCSQDATPSVKLGLAVKWAIKSGANLSSADLSRADLSGADLRRANLIGANLSDADLSGADLRGADLTDADLAGANLARANLARANLTDANLTDANLTDANLTGANLTDAYLAGANLTGADLTDADLADANLTDANLTGADLTDADLARAKNADLTIARTRILADGDLIGWKKCQRGVIVKLRIPADAKRSHAFGRKCRAEFVDVIEVIGAEVGITSQHGPETRYRAGQRVTPNGFDDNWQNECSRGIHFFITRAEAEAY